MTIVPAEANTVTLWLERLQQAGYRLTAPRRAVVETIASSECVLEPAAVFARARERYPRLGLVTVYRTLEKLESLGLVQRIHRPDGCQAFIAAVDGHQHPLICRSCGRVEYFSGDAELITRLSRLVADDSGYDVQEHWLQFFGLCARCR
ncbi:MAG: transcriptional repressor [Anaerolineae bacterium]|nr:MAG: transcriptional repressor [Anaerolineae bacterium]